MTHHQKWKKTKAKGPSVTPAPCHGLGTKIKVQYNLRIMFCMFQKHKKKTRQMVVFMYVGALRLRVFKKCL